MRVVPDLFYVFPSERGHVLSIHQADDPSLSLKEHGEFKYDNLILFSPASEGKRFDQLSFYFVYSVSNLLH